MFFLLKKYKILTLIFGFALSVSVALPSSTTAHKPAVVRPFHIYMVLWSGEDLLSKGFKDYFKRRGIPATYTIRNCNLDRKKCHALVGEIRTLKPDLIFTWGTPTCEEIGGKIDAPNKQDYIWDIPIVSLIVTDPIRSKLIYSLEKPGRNITGVNHVAPVSAHIEAIMTYKKTIKKMAAFYNPTETNSKIMVEELLAKSGAFGLNIKLFPVNVVNGAPDPTSIPGVIDEIHKEGYEFIYIPADTFLSVNMKAVMDSVLQHKILTFGTTESLFFEKDHPLLGLLSRFYDVGLLGGFKAEQILVDSKKPSKIPYQKLDKFSLLFSPKVMKLMKVYPPITMVKIAEFVPSKGTKILIKDDLDPKTVEEDKWNLF